MINIKQLRARQKLYQGHNGYFQLKALPEILAYNKQYRKDNPEKYPYNQSIEDFICSKEEIPEELKDVLGGEIYLSQQDIDEEKKLEYKEKMLAEGYIELNEEVVKNAFENKKKLSVVASMSYDWITSRVEDIYKPFINHEGSYFLMKPRQRTRGTYLSRFENAFCKVI